MGFKKYDGSTWQPITPKKLKGIPYTGTLPATLTGTKAGYLHKYKIFGNTEQTGAPTLENPIVPQECGELETTGVYAGRYKLPLTSAGQNVDIYLGESQTTRWIGKLVLDGTENWNRSTKYTGSFYAYLSDIAPSARAYSPILCTHAVDWSLNPQGQYHYGSAIVDDNSLSLWFFDSYVTSKDFKNYLAQQYANGTPVTVWYIFANKRTVTRNEPLRKIGDYADTIDSTQATAQIPTTVNSTTISWAGEGLAPSGFDSIQEWADIPTHTYTNGEWVADN